MLKFIDNVRKINKSNLLNFQYASLSSSSSSSSILSNNYVSKSKVKQLSKKSLKESRDFRKNCLKIKINNRIKRNNTLEKIRSRNIKNTLNNKLLLISNNSYDIALKIELKIGSNQFLIRELIDNAYNEGVTIEEQLIYKLSNYLNNNKFYRSAIKVNQLIDFNSLNNNFSCWKNQTLLSLSESSRGKNIIIIKIIIIIIIIIIKIIIIILLIIILNFLYYY
jgi:hypothetical protein